MVAKDEDVGSALVTEALTALGLSTAVMAGSHRPVLVTRALALADADTIASRIDRWTAQLGPDQLGVVVADRVTAAARSLLNDAGWGWLDRRGHLRLVSPGMVIDTDVPAPQRTPPAPLVFSQVGRELAVHLLLDPDRPAGVRPAAAALSRAPSSVSASLGALRNEGLVTTERAPVLPDLFWALAEHWETPSVDVATLPGTGDATVLRVHLDEVESTAGWALSDTVAAIAYGAPVASRADHPPDFYVPGASTLRRPVQLLGPATAPATRAARLRVAPVPAACERRVVSGSAVQPWPLAHPLFVALDLARDPGRGREILDGWTPPEPWRRVW